MALQFQFYKSTIIIRITRHDSRHILISILHKYDYNKIETKYNIGDEVISILQKYDYNGTGTRRVEDYLPFQFYKSTIIIC